MRNSVGPEAGTCVPLAGAVAEGGCQSEQDGRFALDLYDRVRRIEDPETLAWTVAEAIGEYLHVARCLFGEIEIETDRALVYRDYHKGLPSAAGTHTLALFSPEMMVQIRAGRTIVNCDARHDPRTATRYEAVYRPLGLDAYVTVPLFREGRLKSLLLVSTDRPRAWSEREIRLLENLGHRAWSAFEQTRLNAALRTSGERLRLITDNVPAVIACLDRNRRFLFVNALYEQWFGAPVSAVLGRALEEIHGTDFYTRARPHLDAVLARGRPVSYEDAIVAADGSRLSVIIRLVPHVEGGEVVGLYALMIDITERQQAEEALRRSKERFELLSETAGRLLATDLPQSIVNSLCRKVLAHLDCEVFIHHLVDEPAGRLHLCASRGLPPRIAEEMEWSELGADLCGSVARAGRRMVAENMTGSADPRTQRLAALGVQAYACYPLFSGERVIGTLAFGARSRPRFTEDELALMQRVADQVAVAMDRARLIEALRASQLELEARVRERTAELAEAHEGLQVEHAFRRAIEDSLVCGIVAVDLEGRQTYVNRSFCEMVGWPEQVLLGATPPFVYWPREQHEAMGKSFRGVLAGEAPEPLELLFRRRNGEHFPALVLQSPLLDGQGRQIGWIASVTDFTHEREVQRRTEATQALLNLFSKESDRKEYLDRALGLIQGWCGCQSAGIRVLDAAGRMVYEAHAGLGPDFVESENLLSVEEDLELGLCPRVVAGVPDPSEAAMMTAAGSFRCENLEGFSAGRPPERKAKCGSCVQAGFRSLALIPIRYQNKAVGLIHLADRRPGALTLEIVQFIESMAPLIGEAVHRFDLEEELRVSEARSRLLSSQLIRVQENERKRVAREIHDSIGQSLSAIKYRVEDVLLQRRKSKILERLRGVVPLCQQSVEEARRIQADLRPPVLDDLGIVAALNGFLRDFQGTYPRLRIDKRTDPALGDLPEAIKIVLYRISQEALNNVAKHSGADRVELSLSKTNDEIELVIRDNGEGFNLEEVEMGEGAGRGMGLAGMRERATLSGGALEIDSAEGSGTTVRATWKLT
ncbi:MAG: PAS domain S-box protein [bacterium]